MKVFVIDVAMCNGCHACQIACKDEHCGADWSPIAKPQPETGQFWMRVDEKERGSVPVVKLAYKPVLCSHCQNAPCMEAAADNSVYKREDGLVIIDPEKAEGRRDIVDSCPIGAIYWNEELHIPQKCTGCAHLLDDGWEVPRCVDVCATGALRFSDIEDFEGALGDAQFLEPVSSCQPLVYYLNLPKRFVAGALIDFSADEVVIGANVKLLDENGAVVREGASDEFGDFMFDQMEPGTYKLVASKEGYQTLEAVANVLLEDLNLGDLAFESAKSPE